MAETAESIRFPEMAQSCHMNNLTSVTYNRFTRGACVSSSQRDTNTAMFFGGELHSGVFVSLFSTEFSANVGALKCRTQKPQDQLLILFGRKAGEEKQKCFGVQCK